MHWSSPPSNLLLYSQVWKMQLSMSLLTPAKQLSVCVWRVGCVCVCLHLRWHRTGVIRGRHAAGRSLEKQCALLPHPPRAGTGRTLLHFIWRLHLWGLSCLLGRLTGLAMSSFPKQGKGCFTWLSGLIISLKWRWWRRVYTPLVSGACVDTACACAVRANVHLIRRVCTL